MFGHKCNICDGMWLLRQLNHRTLHSRGSGRLLPYDACSKSVSSDNMSFFIRCICLFPIIFPSGKQSIYWRTLSQTLIVRISLQTIGVLKFRRAGTRKNTPHAIQSGSRGIFTRLVKDLYKSITAKSRFSKRLRHVKETNVKRILQSKSRAASG